MRLGGNIGEIARMGDPTIKDEEEEEELTALREGEDGTREGDDGT